MQTKPDTAPQQKPFRDIFFVLFINISVNIQLKAPTLAAKLVTTMALTALELIANSEPPLKPNQPNHKNVVPRNTSAILDGLFSLKLTVRLGPTANA